MPEDRERSAVLRRPVEQLRELRLGALRRQAQIALLRQRRVHRRERDLQNVGRCVAVEVPRVEWPRDAGPEADRVGKPQRRVVPEGQLGDVSMRVGAQVVVAVPGDGPGEVLQPSLLLGEPLRVVRRGVAPVQADLRACVAQRRDQRRA